MGPRRCRHPRSLRGWAIHPDCPQHQDSGSERCIEPVLGLRPAKAHSSSLEARGSHRRAASRADADAVHGIPQPHIGRGRGLIITLIPATTALLAAITIKERVTKRQILGLLIGLTGTVVIGLSGDSGLGADGNITAGFALAGAGVIVGSITGIAQRHYAPHHDTIALAMPMFLSGTAVALVVGWFIGFDDVTTFDSDIWVLLVVLGLLSTLLPFGLTLYASKHASATIVAMTAYVAPLVAVLGGAILLDEVITGSIMAGAALSVSGVALVGRSRRTTT